MRTAAFVCFGRNGYKKASMADIARAAAVSKAALFHYFGSKRALYLYLVDISTDAITRALAEGLSGMPDDFFERIHRATLIKIEVMRRHPGMIGFLSARVNESDPEVAEALRQRSERSLGEGIAQFFAGVDTSRFRPGINVEMAMNAVIWIGEGCVRDRVRQKDAETVAQEVLAYMDILRNAFYREA